MQVEVETTIKASAQTIFKTLCDFENWAEQITGIVKIEVNRLEEGVDEGTSFLETRSIMKKEVTEKMHVDICKQQDDGSYYLAISSVSNGVRYYAQHFVKDLGEKEGELKMIFSGEYHNASFVQRLMGFIFGPLGKSMTIKMLEQDFKDLKAYIETQAQ